MSSNTIHAKSEWLGQAQAALRDYCDAKSRFEAAQGEFQDTARHLASLICAWDGMEPCAIPIEHPTKGGASFSNYALVSLAPGYTDYQPRFTVQHTADMIPYPSDGNKEERQ